MNRRRHVASNLSAGSNKQKRRSMNATECFEESLEVKAYRPVDILSVGSFMDDVEETYPRGLYYPRRKIEDSVMVPCCKLFSLDSFSLADRCVVIRTEGIVSRQDFQFVQKTDHCVLGGWKFRTVGNGVGSLEFSVCENQVGITIRSPAVKPCLESVTDPRVVGLNAGLANSELGQIRALETKRANSFLASGKMTLAGGRHEIEGYFESSRLILRLYFRDIQEIFSWVRDVIWAFIEEGFGNLGSVDCFKKLTREEYGLAREELNETWPFGWSIEVCYDEQCAYDSPDRPFRRRSFATNEIPVRLPVLFWQGKEKWLLAEVVHTADESFPELILSGTEAQQAQMLKKTGYEFERWDGPMVDRWT